MMIDEEGPLPRLYGRLENGVAAETILQASRRTTLGTTDRNLAPAIRTQDRRFHCPGVAGHEDDRQDDEMEGEITSGLG